jgi:intracellular multiplication protein IcmJ
MDFYPITLGTGRVLPVKGKPPSSSSKAGTSSAGSLTPALTKEILERDDYICACCGFRSMKYQEILYKDHNQRNNDPNNLLTSCIFCHQCFHLDEVALMKSGALIWLPEIDQATLNNIARAVYVARIAQGPIAEVARKILDSLMSRRAEAAHRISTDDPSILSMVLSDYLSLGQYAERAQKLEGLRLFPLDRRIMREGGVEFNRFPQILAYWRSKDGPLGKHAPKDWMALYQDILARAA